MTNSHIIFLKGRDKTHEIAHCELIGEKLLVRFKNNPKVFTYVKLNFVISPKAKILKCFAICKALLIYCISDDNSKIP
ncbi:hypothetical protein [Helicobacter pullorum]|uniref:hypothetical protein n=1 Tax=Helicobacter pullorum TaxID=35818 RepID=UPI000CF01720|nr:hypothetical protein [Helicobacter pullorum]